MSNHFSFGIFPYGRGYLAWIRKCSKAGNEIIKDAGGAHKLYPSKFQALEAAGKHFLAYVNGDIRAMEEHGTREGAEAQFARIVKGERA